jgi:hypothetical protein
MNQLQGKVAQGDLDVIRMKDENEKQVDLACSRFWLGVCVLLHVIIQPFSFRWVPCAGEVSFHPLYLNWCKAGTSNSAPATALLAVTCLLLIPHVPAVACLIGEHQIMHRVLL